MFIDILSNVAVGHNAALIFVNNDNANASNINNNNTPNNKSSQSDKANTNGNSNDEDSATMMSKIAFSLLQKIMQSMTNDNAVKR